MSPRDILATLGFGARMKLSVIPLKLPLTFLLLCYYNVAYYIDAIAKYYPPHRQALYALFEKTPEEHLEDARVRDRNQGPPPRKVPDRHVRIAWYPSLDLVNTKVCHVEWDIPLEPCGDLDLGKLKRRWGFDDCSAVDPYRYTLVKPANPDRLTALALRVLQEGQGYVILIEHPSPLRVVLRSWRTSVKNICRKTGMTTEMQLLLLASITLLSLPFISHHCCVVLLSFGWVQFEDVKELMMIDRE
ncbi:hypothetical protein JAAARDRAFT_194985 [Jaapia argillacea MUCL 33604]|uniref:Uncharacterized protein n=1 Tax=Jaapia argillacea MUCL 33604 TaxID=933084 RepID=A0A067Q163_9AGAM|nr:hypothetical protein JAAARDRAFT_194985 [Jaapia argillacea MUCL 33604]